MGHPCLCYHRKFLYTPVYICLPLLVRNLCISVVWLSDDHEAQYNIISVNPVQGNLVLTSERVNTLNDCKIGFARELLSNI